jgi:predicted ATPase/class 3 adenylate cyclase
LGPWFRGLKPSAGVRAISYALLTHALTFLFTDIQGSTALLSRLGGDAYAEILSDHHQVIRAGLAAHDGREVDTQGDGFFAVFSSPRACGAAVIEMQRALARRQWTGGEQVRVRMGMHCGEASEMATGLVGIDVHRAARIAAVAHGGQVVLSAAAAALVADSLPPDASLRDLGLHRLKDLDRPERIFQLQAEGLAVDFPPLKSLDNPDLPNNLPGFLSGFVGREGELAEVHSLLESSRLVTLTGAGGSGKTRLALQIAAEMLDGSGEGVWFVDLAKIAESEHVPGAVASALGLGQQASRPQLERLLEVLGDQDVLIVLDNCEHVIDACAKLADLVHRNCPRVHLLATSREPLAIDGELVYRVRPLSLPSEDADTVEEVEASDAVRLFVARARSHDDTFSLDDSMATLVASICRRLDGIPFAIELAAARLASMSLVNLNERLDRRFRLLTGGSRNALPRQQTLQATVEWSFDLLSPPEQEVLRRLAVFVGGFELDAAEAVCSLGTAEVFEVADLLGSLVNKSLVVAERSSGSLRYRLLETIRQYAASQLVEVGGEAEARKTQSIHADFYLQLSEAAAPELTGRSQGAWLKRLDLEWDNVRAALVYLCDEPDRIEDVLRLGVALPRFFESRGHLEAVEYLRAALERSEGVPAALRARSLFAIGDLVASLFATEDRLELCAATELVEQALDMAKDLDDRKLVAEALTSLSWVAHLEGESSQATRLAEEAVATARTVGDPRVMGEALSSLASAEPTLDRKRELRLESLAGFRQAGDALSTCRQSQSLGSIASEQGHLEAARAYAEESIATAEEIGARRLLAFGWSDLGVVLLLQGELEEAAQWSRKSLISCRRVGNRRGAAFAIFVLACCATHAGEHLRAAQLTGAHDVIDAAVIQGAPNRAHFWTLLEQQARDDNRARLRQLLGESEFERAGDFRRCRSVHRVRHLPRRPMDRLGRHERGGAALRGVDRSHQRLARLCRHERGLPQPLSVLRREHCVLRQLLRHQVRQQ